MLPTLEGRIVRRVLVNFRIEPEWAQRCLPPPFEPEIRNGFAVAGVCLIRMAELRPKHLPAWVGVGLESAAHRMAVRQPQALRDGHGVYIFRRDTNSRLTEVAGGWVFPSRFDRADFRVDARPSKIGLAMRTADGVADLSFSARAADSFSPTPLFQSLSEAVSFFEEGDRGYSPSTRPDRFDGVQLVTPSWRAEPLSVDTADITYFQQRLGVPRDAMTFDSAFLIADLAHEWVALPPVTVRTLPPAAHAAKLGREVRAAGLRQAG